MRKSLTISCLILIVAALVFSTQPARLSIAQGGTEDDAAEGGGGGSAGVNTSGNYVAAAPNYAVKVNGFGFENYGSDKPVENLTPAEVRRMFGDQACASLEGETCILTPSAQQWMEQINKDMGGGHCEGMAVLSLLLYLQKEKPADFGGDVPFDLKLDSNDKLQREIAYWWATQAVEPVQSAEIKKTPNEIVDLLKESFKEGSSETYTIGITKRDGTGGHAVTPWAIEDRGGGKFWILVYDNNWPGVNRAIEVDHEKNTWVYEASTNPSEPADTYDGDAETVSLTLAPTSKRFGTLACPFCANAGETSHAGLARLTRLVEAAQQYNQIWLDGEGKLLITDAQGRHYGYVNGKFVKEIPGVKSFTVRSGDLWKTDESPTFLVPTGMAFTLTVDGTGLKLATTTDVVMIGPGYDLGVEGVKLEPGQQDTLTFSPDGSKLTYKTNGSESPDIVLGLEAKGADYGFDIKGVDLDGGVINVTLDKAKGQLILNTTGNKTAGTYSLIVDRIDDKGEQTFSHDNITLAPNDTAYLDYGKWSGNKGSMALGIDHGSTGKIAETLELTDEQ